MEVDSQRKNSKIDEVATPTFTNSTIFSMNKNK
jgi:hypothetical protein